ncbi:MAG: Crp/Fnr family transcriptional regulator [Lentisphaeria bacterium]|nr:Crp/Fnr family transcriptional regulator [Lentisphaeria bacterium]
MKLLRLHPIEKAKYLKKCDLFAGLPPADHVQLAGVAKYAEYARGELLFVKDEPAESLFIVAKGKLKIYCLSPDGREQIVHIIHPGDMCAEVPMFSGGAYPANAAAMVKTDVIIFSREAFLREARARPEILMSMLANISQRLRTFVTLVDDLSLKDVSCRLARFLLARVSQGCVELTESKKTLAGQLGTVPETLSRTLNDFQKRGWITVDGKRITIHTQEGLAMLLED